MLSTGFVYTLSMLETERAVAEEIHARDPELALAEQCPSAGRSGPAPGLAWSVLNRQLSPR